MPLKTFLSVIAGAIVFCILFYLFAFTIKLAVIISAVVGVLFLIVSYAQKKQSEVELFFSGVQDKSLQNVLRDGYDKQQRLKSLRTKVFKAEIREKLTKIIDVVDRIYADFKKEPKDIKAARQFLNYYLDSTITIVTKYTELSAQSSASADVAASIAKSEELLDKIHAAFEAQLAKLLEDDAMNLDTEIELLEKTFKMEGLQK